ncbi:uncharacterized protein E0L32_005533 [Thyridium curvatum]|uniref:Uncharacterized protein n=1 Tax=Thyridium curvatum TaxID=1093900 RepID=A0A507B3L0_9PEZI|nr:uncharacterized protein E0L32_005533 [Thyridium curvatum]TPX14337.1 hypothetical protein E0L32_005533 [Thyridium curvatum]
MAAVPDVVDDINMTGALGHAHANTHGLGAIGSFDGALDMDLGGQDTHDFGGGASTAQGSSPAYPDEPAAYQHW